MSERIRLGIVGTGRMAATMARTVDMVPYAELVAVASSTPQRARWFAEKFKIRGICESAAALAQRADVDAVYVATRTRGHALAARAAIAAGKPVMVEKPFALTLEEGQALVAEARARGSLLIENLWCLALPAYSGLFDRVRSGSYGAPVHLTFDFGYPADPTGYQSLFDGSDGGALRDRGVYGVSLALRLLGPVREIASFVCDDPEGVDVSAALQFQHANGSTSQIAVSIISLMSNTATLACTRGILRIDAPSIGSESLSACRMSPVSAPKLVTPGLKGKLVEGLKKLSAPRRLNRFLTAPRTTTFPYGSGPYRPILQHFCDLVRSGRAESETVPLDLSLDTLRIIDASRTVGRVIFDESAAR